MMNTTARYRGSTTFLLVYSELINAARYRGTVTYQELALLMGLPTQGSHMGREIGIILGEISEDEHQHGRPMLSAIAVNVNGQASEGFYSLAKLLGKLQDDSKEGRQRFWDQEKTAVYVTWRQQIRA